MVTSETDICNMALRNLGTAKRISNLQTDRSEEGSACRTFYENARDAILRLRNWSFASKLVQLSLVSDAVPTGTLPPPNQIEWTYVYRVPSDCLFFRRILSGIRNDNRQTRIPFREIADAQGKLILTDMKVAIGEYTFQAKQVSFFPPDFVEALAYRLASLIAPSVTAGDPFKMGPLMLKLYELSVSTAAAATVNEEQVDVPAESEFVRAREGLSGVWPQDPFTPSSIIRGGS